MLTIETAKAYAAMHVASPITITGARITTMGEVNVCVMTFINGPHEDTMVVWLESGALYGEW